MPYTRVLDTVSNKIGTFFGAGLVPAPGARRATVRADMPSAEIIDASNWLRLAVYADFGRGPQWMAKSPEWRGGPGSPVPLLVWDFDPAAPPAVVYGVLENGTRGAGSPAVVGLSLLFS